MIIRKDFLLFLNLISACKQIGFHFDGKHHNAIRFCFSSWPETLKKSIGDNYSTENMLQKKSENHVHLNKSQFVYCPD